jgi:hypothetical protein
MVRVAVAFSTLHCACRYRCTQPVRWRAVCHVLHRANDEWYAIDDLSVQEILAQQVALTETYLQIFERADLTAEQVRVAPFRWNLLVVVV